MTFLKTLWRKGAMSFSVEAAGHTSILQIERTSFGAFCAYLDGSPLEPEIKVPKIFFSAQRLILPDGSTVRVSAWGALGWSLKREGVALRPISRKPVLLQLVLVLLIAGIIGLGTGFCIWWFNRPEWKRAQPPLWAFVTSSTGDNGKTRWFIHTKAIRKDVTSRTVKVLMRGQTIANGEPEGADIRKDDEFTSVQNFTCDPSKKGYDLSATLRTISGKQLPEELPPDSELPKALAWRDFVQIRPGTVIANTREAACFLAGYK